MAKPTLDLMASDRKITISYSLSVPDGVNPPVLEQSNEPIPAKGTVTFPIGDGKTVDYKNVLAAIQSAKEVTGSQLLTPWRDAVGDKEKNKDGTPSQKDSNEEDGEEEDAEETIECDILEG